MGTCYYFIRTDDEGTTLFDFDKAGDLRRRFESERVIDERGLVLRLDLLDGIIEAWFRGSLGPDEARDPRARAVELSNAVREFAGFAPIHFVSEDDYLIDRIHDDGPLGHLITHDRYAPAPAYRVSNARTDRTA